MAQFTSYTEALELVIRAGFKLAILKADDRALTVRWDREPKAIELKIPAPMMEREIVVNKRSAWVLRTGRRTRRVVSPRLRISPWSGGYWTNEDWDKETQAALANHLRIAEMWIGGDRSEKLTGVTTVSWPIIWAEAVIAGLQGAMSVWSAQPRLCQGHIDKHLSRAILALPHVRGENEVEVFGHSLVCEYPSQGCMPEAPRQVVKRLFAAVAGLVGCNLAATPKSTPGREFLDSEFVQETMFALTGASVIDQRGLREVSSGLRNARELKNHSTGTQVPEWLATRVQVVNVAVAQIPGITRTYCDEDTTGGEMLLTGDCSLIPIVTKSQRLEDLPGSSIEAQAAGLNLLDAEGNPLYSIERTQVGGGITRAAYYEESMPTPRGFKVLLPAGGMKGMAIGTTERFAELRPDGYHMIELVVAPDDVQSKKAGVALALMLASHSAEWAPKPEDTYEDLLSFIDEKVGYDAVPIFRLDGGAPGSVILADGSTVYGVLEPVIGDDGAQLETVTGRLAVMVMPEGEHYGEHRRGEHRAIGLSPWAIVPAKLPVPAQPVLLPIIKAAWDLNPPAEIGGKVIVEEDED
jgi:hypothetical protein